MCVSGSVNYSYHTEIKDAIAGVPNGGLSLSTTVSSSLSLSLAWKAVFSQITGECVHAYICVFVRYLYSRLIFLPRVMSAGQACDLNQNRARSLSAVVKMLADL